MNSGEAPQARTLLRDRRLISLLMIFSVAILSAQLSVTLVANFMPLTNAERFVEDFELAKESRSLPSDGRVAIVAVNEDTLQQFPYRSPVDRAFLATLIEKIDSAHPRAIGIDLLFDQPTLPEKDAALAAVLHHASSPIVIAYTETDNVTPRQLAYERSFVPDAMRATPDLPRDQFGTVRTVHPGMMETGGRYLFSFERALAAKWGTPTPSDPVPIVWHVPSGGAKYNYFEIPAQKVIQFPPAAFSAAVGPALFKNKIVLVGSDLSLIDRHRTPFSAVSDAGNMPGVIVHAYGLSTLLDRAVSPYASWYINLVTAFALALVGAVLGFLNFHLLPRIFTVLAILTVFFIASIYLFHFENILLNLLAPAIAMIGSFSAMDSLAGREARQQRQFIEGAFSRYVSPKIVRALIADPSRMSLEGERREMTYLFTDIADSTTMSENMDSRELGRMLNAYFEGVTSIVLRHEGMLDKFIGDAVFAIFNAPVDLADHARRAVYCALEIDEFCERFRKDKNALGVALGLTRVGVHTGTAVIGNFGSTARFNYTAHGDAVNTASRLESLNKQFGTHICVSGDTKALCPGIDFRPIASVILKGKAHAVDVWEPLPEGKMSPRQIDRYCAAFASLRAPDGRALELFDELAHELPDDPCVRLHVARLRKGIKNADLVMSEK